MFFVNAKRKSILTLFKPKLQISKSKYALVICYIIFATYLLKLQKNSGSVGGLSLLVNTKILLLG